MKIISFLILLISLTACSSNNWTLSLYSNGETITRLNNLSEVECIRDGERIIENSNIERYDCGYECDLNNNLEKAISCKKVCNNTKCQ